MAITSEWMTHSEAIERLCYGDDSFYGAIDLYFLCNEGRIERRPNGRARYRRTDVEAVAIRRRVKEREAI